MSIKQEKRIRRHKKIRINMHGTMTRPRLFVFRSNQHIYVQVIDDQSRKTLASFSSLLYKQEKDYKRHQHKRYNYCNN